ncbi:hypothetical protein [Streptomyces sp. NBC_01508]|uniref:hypothetical protein n=1 Tax=Streptomyces sp. NBC_01508 TaxID=2903888 RepID=UPI0038692B22
MGGRRHIPDARPTALLSAVATLLAALYFCLVPAETRTHHPAASSPAAPAAASDGITLRTEAANTAAGPAAAASEYTCPYDRGNCRFLPHLSPAVLTAPHPADPLGVDDVAPARLVVPSHAGQVSRSGVFPRAPDPHVLQVLRT